MSATTYTSTAPAGVPTVDESTLPGRTDQIRRLSLLVGGAGFLAWAALALLFPTVLRAYLVAYIFFVGLSVGSLGLLMLHYLVGGDWGFVIRRPLESATSTLPLMALLFIPLLLGAYFKVPSLYPWAVPDEVHAHEVLKLKAGYLNLGAWTVRAAVYLALWNGLAFVLRRNSVAQDRTTDPSPTWTNQTISGPGLAFTFLSVTFASIDWVMSIEPEWYSTIYGVIYVVSWALTSLSAAVIVASFLANVRPLTVIAKPVGFHDLGNLMLAFTMLWAYTSFSQYLIIWSGNLAEDVPWYLRRSAGGWRAVAFCLILFHFFVPFFCLLIREVKRSTDRLWRVAVAILVMHFVSEIWLVIPAQRSYQWLALLALVPAVAAVGGLWIWVYTTTLTRRTLLPANDPLLHEALSFHLGEDH